MGVLSPALEKMRLLWRLRRSLWRSYDLDVGKSSRFGDPHRLKPWVYEAMEPFAILGISHNCASGLSEGKAKSPFGPKKHERLVALNESVRPEQSVPPQAQYRLQSGASSTHLLNPSEGILRWVPSRKQV